MLRQFMAAIAEFELEKTRQRTKDGARRKVALGIPNGHGDRPYGWRRVFHETSGKTIGFEHEPAEVEVLRRMCRELLADSLLAVCRRFTAEGIPTPRQGRSTERRRCNPFWTPPMMMGLLDNPMLWGEYQFGRQRKVKANGKTKVLPGDPDQIVTINLPPIVARADVDRVWAAMAERRHKRRGRGPMETDEYTLRGLLRCALCGGQMSTGASKGRQPGKIHRYYSCLRHEPARAREQGTERCSMTRVPAEKAEAYVLAVVKATLCDLERLQAAIAATRAADDSAARHAERICALEDLQRRKTAALERVVKNWAEAETETEREAFGVVRAQLVRELAQFKADLEQLRNFKPRGITEDEEAALLRFSAEIAGGMDVLTIAERREVFELLRLRGEVRTDPSGPVVGAQRRFSLDLSADVSLNPLGPSSSTAAFDTTSTSLGYDISRRAWSMVNHSTRSYSWSCCETSPPIASIR
jgi:hypothetical protein